MHLNVKIMRVVYYETRNMSSGFPPPLGNKAPFVKVTENRRRKCPSGSATPSQTQPRRVCPRQIPLILSCHRGAERLRRMMRIRVGLILINSIICRFAIIRVTVQKKDLFPKGVPVPARLDLRGNRFSLVTSIHQVPATSAQSVSCEMTKFCHPPS